MEQSMARITAEDTTTCKYPQQNPPAIKAKQEDCYTYSVCVCKHNSQASKPEGQCSPNYDKSSSKSRACH